MKDLIMNAKVVFKATESHPEFYIRRISEVEIESSWKMICSTAQVVLPRNIKDFNQNKVKDWFKRGDKVEIYLCYGLDEDLILEFSGYITQVSADYPITIKLEDEMWRLKQIPVNFSSKNEKLKSFVQYFIDPRIRTIFEEEELDKDKDWISFYQEHRVNLENLFNINRFLFTKEFI